jgi:excisionase family DNA binding protein
MKRSPAAHQRDGQILHVADVAALLGCSQKSIRARVARQIIPHRRLGSRVIFRRAELEQFLDALPGVSLIEAQNNLAFRSGGERQR